MGSKNASNKVSYCNVIAIYSISSTIIFFFVAGKFSIMWKNPKNIRKYLMLDIFYFSKLKNTRVRHFPGWTSWQQWTVGSSRTAPVAKPSGYLHFLVVSFLCVEYFRSVAKPPICCDGIVRGESYLGPWVFPMPSGSELLIFNVHSINGFCLLKVLIL